eukprot:3754428-Pyramimonas_sp.AAC.1
MSRNGKRDNNGMGKLYESIPNATSDAASSYPGFVWPPEDKAGMKQFKDNAFKRVNVLLKMVAATHEAKEDATTQRNEISVIKFQ